MVDDDRVCEHDGERDLVEHARDEVVFRLFGLDGDEGGDVGFEQVADRVDGRFVVHELFDHQYD